MRKKTILFATFILLFSYLMSAGLAQNKIFLTPSGSVIIDSTTLKIKMLAFNHQNSSYVISNDRIISNNHLLVPSQIDQRRLYFSSLLLVSLNYTAYQPFKHVWWEEERTQFHFYRGWRRTKGYWDFGWHDSLYGHMDKLGHYYCSKLLSEQFYSLCRWIGFQESSSKLMSPILSSLVMLEVEIYDGFFREWGFSLADFTANELGAFSPLLKEHLSFLNHFQLKFSYHPSRLPKKDPTFIKDYAGMTFWLSYNIHSALPQKLKPLYPPWLNLSLGYGVSKLSRAKVELYLAPDIDWTKAPFGQSQPMVWVKKILNYFHFPCFSFKLIPEKRFYPVYF